MTINKHPILPDMVRRVPDQFSWIDHRLVREGYIDYLSHSAAALYLFLVTVSDSRGLSYYSDETLSRRLGMDPTTLAEARMTLIRRQLVAYRKPLYQVLALDSRHQPVRSNSEPSSIGQVLQQIMGGANDRL
jgi:hypothetical protein